MTAIRMLDGTTRELPEDRVWTCSVCATRAPWTDTHRWYGSYSDLEGGRSGTAKTSIVVTCSDGCREFAAVKDLVPDDAVLLT